MSKITTEDCKKFIVDFHKKNPNIEMVRFDLNESDISNPDNTFLKDILETKNWKRLFKMKPSDEYDCSLIYISGKPTNSYAEPNSRINITDIRCIRGFDMITADGQIAYLVLEMNDGTLHLGDYIGD